MQDRFPDCPVERSHTCVPLLTILKLSINRLGPSFLPREPPPSASDLLKYPSCAPTGRVVFMGFSVAFYSSMGKSSPRVIATADGALLFHVPSALWFRVLGGFFFFLKEKEKLAKGDTGSL